MWRQRSDARVGWGSSWQPNWACAGTEWASGRAANVAWEAVRPPRSRSPRGACAASSPLPKFGQSQLKSQAALAKPSLPGSASSSRAPPPVEKEFPVVARLLSGRELATVSLCASSPIAVLRKAVVAASAATSSAPAAFDLVCDGRLLADRELAGAAGLKDGAEVTVLRTEPFKILAAFDDHAARLFDGVTGVCERCFDGHRNQVKTAAFSPDGSKVVTASDDFMVKVYSTSSGACLSTFRSHRNNVNMASFCPDGHCVLTASDDGTARLLKGPSPVVIYKGHQNVVNSAVFSSDGLRVLTASDDRTSRLYETQTGDCLKIFRHNGFVHSATFSPDAKYVLTACADGAAYLFLVETGELERRFADQVDEPDIGFAVRCANFSPDGTRLLLVASAVKVFSFETGQCERSFPIEDGDMVWSAVFSPEGDKVLTASEDGLVRLLSLETGECIRTYETASSKPRGRGRSRPSVMSAVFAPKRRDG